MVKNKRKVGSRSQKNSLQSVEKKKYTSFKELFFLLNTLNNISTQEEKIIFLIYEYTTKGQKVNRKTIEKQLNIYRQRVERIIDELYYKKLILRHDDQENRIKYHLTLTEEGLEYIKHRVCDYSKALDMLRRKWKIKER